MRMTSSTLSTFFGSRLLFLIRCHVSKSNTAKLQTRSVSGISASILSKAVSKMSTSCARTESAAAAAPAGHSVMLRAP